MPLFPRPVILCILATNVGQAASQARDKISIDSQGILNRVKKTSRLQQKQLIVGASSSESSASFPSPKKLIRSEETLPKIILPVLGNYYGASLLFNRTRRKLSAFLQNWQHVDKSSSATFAEENWINSTMANSSLVHALFVFIGLGLILSCIIIALAFRRGSEEAPASAQQDGGSGATALDGRSLIEKDVKRTPEGLDEDLYGMGIASLIRDSQRFALRTELFYLRVGRMAISMLVLVFTMTLQVFLLVEMKALVTSVSTHEARDTYDKYEIWMYGNNTADMEVTANGYHRGKDGNFDISRFATLDDDLKDSACQMPLSQPTFFIAILLVWALVCVAEMRRTIDLACSLLIVTPTISSMKDACQEIDDGSHSVLVVGLTRPVKIIVSIFILLPRMVVSAILLWLGCRWLTGTMGFSDVLQNAVTLEFILMLKDLFYATMVPHHNKAETRQTLLQPHCEKERPTAAMFLGAFLWGLLSILWVLFYVAHFQMVLPEYKWDIHDACADYLHSVEQATPDSG